MFHCPSDLMVIESQCETGSRVPWAHRGVEEDVVKPGGDVAGNPFQAIIFRDVGEGPELAIVKSVGSLSSTCEGLQ